MSPIFYIALAGLLAAQLLIKKQYAFLPILIATYHFGNYEFINNVTPIRAVILIGVTRAISAGNFNFSLRNKLDLTLVLFSAYIFFSSFFHSSRDFNPFYMRLGLILDILGTYIYCRCWIQNRDDMLNAAKSSAIVIAPLAITMVFEFLTQSNPYSSFGARHALAGLRDGKVRAAGPFAHAILLGTSGGAMVALMIGIKRESKKLYLIGIAAALTIVFTSSSSGPAATAVVCFGCMYLVKYRNHLRLIKVVGVIMIIFASIGMGKAPWHLMAKIDIVGGSTGWHRARLMDRGWQYLGDWWFAGTDYTRHWMASGVAWSGDHVDMTNYYLHIGVIAGLPALLFLVRGIFITFNYISELLASVEEGSRDYIFIWSWGATLFAHCITFVSVSYFDQISTIFYLLLAGVASSHVAMKKETRETSPASGNQAEYQYANT